MKARAGVLPGLGLALGAAMVAATAIGSVEVPVSATLVILGKCLGFPTGPVDQKWEAIVVLIRLPRVLGAALIGAALATAGAVLQSLLRNPMADPGLLGVSSGAGFGAVLSIGLGLASQSLWFTPLFAVAGALTASAVIVGLSLRKGQMPVFTLILAGLAVSTFFGAGTSLVLSLVSHDNVAQFLFWAMGTLANTRWDTLGLAAAPVALGMTGLLLFGRDLNVLALGEAQARSLGVDVPGTRLTLMVLVSVTTAGAVCTSGPVGFVGLMVPPMLRLVLGPDNRMLLPASALGGAVFLVVCDLISRVVSGPLEVNVGIVTSLLGAPYFLFLLVRASREKAA